MNKIERAIYEAKLHIRDKERKLLICEIELKTFKDQLNTLEVIQDDKPIPNETLISRYNEKGQQEPQPMDDSDSIRH